MNFNNLCYNSISSLCPQQFLRGDFMADQNTLVHLLNVPLDQDYKIRIAREKLGMCFPDEISFHSSAD